jgi:DNA-3-methyladenine glycosylase II
LGEGVLTNRIATLADVAHGAQELIKTEPRFAPALAVTEPLQLRRKPDGFAALMSAIVSQQVSVAAARAIEAKCVAGGLSQPAIVRNAAENEMRACGLSRQKVKYLKALAEARLDYDALRDAPTDNVVRTLVAVPGIGPWTAEIYAMFSLGHADVFAHGDLALQEATRLLFDLPSRPNERAMRDIARKWAPWRAVAARLLWAYYHVEKQRDGIS